MFPSQAKSFTFENVGKYIERINIRAFHINPFHLVLYYKFEEDGDDIAVYTENGNLLFPTKQTKFMVGRKIWCYKKSLENIKNLGLSIKNINVEGKDYFYKTSDFINLNGSDFKKIRKEINHFTKNYNYKIVQEHPIEKVKHFLDNWYNGMKSRKSSEQLESCKDEYEVSLDVAKHLKKWPAARAMYALVDNKLAGLAYFAPTYKDFWVALIQKTDKQYLGLGKFMYHEKAKLMADYETFTNGSDCNDPSLISHKQRLNPVRVEENFPVEIA